MNNSLRTELKSLLSEQRNERTMELDSLSALEIVRRINAEDKLVATAVEMELFTIARVVEEIALAFKANGRLIYLGAGTSGRLGILDAAECPPTFSVDANQVIGVMAGGREAMFMAVEGAEDNPALARSDLRALRLNVNDVVVGITASGRTPYVIGGIEYANELSCVTVALTANQQSRLAKIARYSIATEVGPEALTGSTRMKAASAHKMVLNMLSTASMVRSGKCFQNLMVDVKTSNEKLYARAINIVVDATGISSDAAVNFLALAKWQVKPAILMALTGVDFEAALTKLEHSRGHLRSALQ